MPIRTLVWGENVHEQKNKVVAEYALRDGKKPMGVAEYQLVHALPTQLKTSLPSIEQIEAELKESVGTPSVRVAARGAREQPQIKPAKRRPKRRARRA